MIFNYDTNKTHFHNKGFHLASFWKWDFLELGNGLLKWVIIWTGGLPHRSALPHLPGVPHLHENRPSEKGQGCTFQFQIPDAKDSIGQLRQWSLVGATQGEPEFQTKIYQDGVVPPWYLFCRREGLPSRFWTVVCLGGFVQGFCHLFKALVKVWW